MKARIPMLISALLLAPQVATAQSAGGFAEVRAQAYSGVDGTPVAAVQRVRPTFTADFTDRLSLSSTVELLLVEGRDTQDELEQLFDDAGLGAALDASGLGRASHENDVLRIDGASDYLGVERLYLDAYLPWFDLRVGRQALNWGSAFVVNPTDPFPEVLLVEPWKLRSGVNAARATIPIGDLHLAQVVVAGDDTLTHPRIAGRATLNWLETDFSIVGAWREDASDGIAGVDIRGTLGVGFWVEAAAHLREDPYEEVAVGFDYSFPVMDALVITGQYYRNGSGSSRQSGPSAALGLSGDLSDDPFGPFFSGKNYVMAAVALSMSPEVSTSTLWVQNLDDGTALWVPSITITPESVWEFALAAQVPLSTWGDGGELRPNPGDLKLSLPDQTGTFQQVDLGKLVPDATLTAWARLNF
jgi:hypothetical protein